MSAGLLCRLRRSFAAVLLVGLAVPAFAQTTPVATFAVSSSTTSEDADTHNVVINLSPAPTSGITITYTVLDLSTTPGDDYTISNSGSISVVANANSVNIPVVIIDDSTPEISEAAILMLAAGSGYMLGSQTTHNLIINDNDGVTASFHVDTSSAGEDAGTHNVRVNLFPAVDSDTTLTYMVGGAGTATSGDDYTALSGTVSLISQQSLANIPVTITDDSTDETDETIILTLTAGSGYMLGATSVHTLTITDNDTAGVTITETADATTPTEGGTDEYGMVLDTQPTANVTITPTSSTPTTATVNPNNLVFTSANWDMAQTFTVTGEDNDDDAANQEVTITHIATSTDANYNLTLAPITATVIDDDATTVTLTGATGNIIEGTTKAITVTLGRTLAAGETLPVPLTFMGTALPGTDYTVTGAAADGVTYTGLNSATGTVTFTGPSAASATLTLSATTDNNDETTGETVIIGLGTLDSNSGTGLGGGATGTDSLDNFNIEDPLTIRITSGPTTTEGSAATFTVTTNRAPAANLPIRLTVTDAAAPSDYLTAGNEGTRMATLTGGTTTTTVDIDTQADNTDEPNGTLTVTIADGTGYTVGIPSSAMVQVSDDDATTVTLAGTMGNLSEATTRNLTVTLNRPLVAGESLAVPLTLGGTATRGTDYTVTGTPADGIAYTIPDSGTAGTVTFTGPAPATATLALAVQTDNTADSGETITIGLGTLVATGLDGGTRSTGSLAFTIMEQPAIVLPPTLAVTEGASVDYPVSLATTPTGNVTVAVTGHSGTDLTLSPDDLTFTSTNWNMMQTFTVMAGADDDAVDDTATLTHTATGGNYNGLMEEVTVNTTDDDTAGLSFSSGMVMVAEGASANYTVALTSVPTGDVTVTVGGHSGTDLTLSPANLTFAMTNWDTVQTFTVTAAQDGDTADDTVTLTHMAAGTTAYGTVTGAVTVTITDNDMAGVLITETGGNTTVAEAGGTDTYGVMLNTQPTNSVEITATSDLASAATVGPLTLTFTMGNWNTVQTFTVMGMNDDIDNAGDARMATISHGAVSTDAGYGAGLDIADVDVTVTDDDAALVGTEEMQAQMQAAQEAWLPRFGLTAVEHLLGGLDYRLSVADQAGLSGNVSGLSAGRALHGAGNKTGTGYAANGFGQGGGGDDLGAGSVDRILNLSLSLSLRDMLRGSRFVHRGGENGVSIWGQASYSRYEDDQDGITVDGEVTTGLLGVDRDNGRTLLGLALSYSDGDGDWSGTVTQGELSSRLTSLLPYIRHNVTQRLQVWAAASYGRGELEQTLEQTSATMSTEHDIEQRSASAGVRGTLLERPLEEGGLTLTLISDAALARIESDDADGMSGMSADTERFRMGLEWSWQLPQADGGRLIPELELGMRYDGGDTSDGLGVELGGGISWQLPSKGLTIDLRGRRLLDHEADERREWGVSGSLRYERQPGSAHGPSLSLRQEYGTAPASGGLDRLLSDSLSDALEEDSSQPGPASGRWSLQGEWGLALKDGATGIPYAGLSSSDSGHDLTLGWRLLSAPGDLDTELDVKALRRRDGEGRANHGIGAQWKLRW